MYSFLNLFGNFQLAAFTDLDTSSADLEQAWKAAKSALVLMMRSWPGIVQICSDDMGLPTIVRMLRDPKIPIATQDVILEVLSDILLPVHSQRMSDGSAKKHQVWSMVNEQKSKIDSKASLHRPTSGK